MKLALRWHFNDGNNRLMASDCQRIRDNDESWAMDTGCGIKISYKDTQITITNYARAFDIKSKTRLNEYFSCKLGITLRNLGAFFTENQDIETIDMAPMPDSFFFGLQRKTGNKVRFYIKANYPASLAAKQGEILFECVEPEENIYREFFKLYDTLVKDCLAINPKLAEVDSFKTVMQARDSIEERLNELKEQDKRRKV